MVKSWLRAPAWCLRYGLVVGFSCLFLSGCGYDLLRGSDDPGSSSSGSPNASSTSSSSTSSNSTSTSSSASSSTTTTTSSSTSSTSSTSSSSSSSSTSSSGVVTPKPWLQTDGNPFVDAALYVNPDVVNHIEQTLVLADSDQEAAQMRQAMAQPTAIWLDRIEAIAGGEDNNGRLSLEAQLENAVAYQASLAEGDELPPTTVVTVLNNLPGRDCTATTSNAILLPNREDLARYKTEFIEVIAHRFAQYPSLRIVAILEPNAVVDYIHGDEDDDCALLIEDGVHAKALTAAAEAFAELDNVYA